MLGQTHRPAAIPPGAQVETLRRADAKANRITPDSIVTVINRGRVVLERKWDGEDYALRPFTHNGGTEDAPYLMSMPYAPAAHFQHHCPVAGTRDPNSPDLRAESWLGILDLDPPEACIPFTVEQCHDFGQAIEAIERSPDEPVKVVEMKDVNKSRAGAANMGNSRRPEFTQDIARAHMQPPDAVSEEIRQEAAEGEAVDPELAGAGAGGGGRKGSRKGH